MIHVADATVQMAANKTTDARRIHEKMFGMVSPSKSIG
jgi:hypothetical protein